jgi:FtsP/CotA-like multicopper oxidase with cupredoxin domain
LIKIPQNATINLKVTNDIADITSTVHHHGLRLNNTQDGVPVSMGGFDVPIAKGESLSYELSFPDAGIYRYHPHVREDVQQELGMYGNYVVVPEDKTYRNAVDQEELLILDDIQMDDKGIAPFHLKHTNQTIMGRFGTHFLLNGSEDYNLTLTQGQVTRLYVTNTANVRPFNITIP